MAFTFNIVERIGVYGEYEKKGEVWTKEINMVSWNSRPPKLDLRTWNEDHTIMEKGITLTNEEAEKVAMILHNFIAERK